MATRRPWSWSEVWRHTSSSTATSGCTWPWATGRRGKPTRPAAGCGGRNENFLARKNSGLRPDSQATSTHTRYVSVAQRPRETWEGSRGTQTTHLILTPNLSNNRGPPQRMCPPSSSESVPRGGCKLLPSFVERCTWGWILGLPGVYLAVDFHEEVVYLGVDFSGGLRRATLA